MSSLRVSQELQNEARAYMEHEFTRAGTLDPEDLFKPTVVSRPELNGPGQSGISSTNNKQGIIICL